MLCGMLLDNKIIKMNNIINKFLLAGDKFMPEMHLRQPQFIYSACGPFTRHSERINKFKQTGDTRYIYRNYLDNIASNPKYHGYQRGLASMVYKFFDEKSIGSDMSEPSSLK